MPEEKTQPVEKKKNESDEYLKFPIVYKRNIGTIECRFTILGYPKFTWEAGMGLGCHFGLVDSLSLNVVDEKTANYTHGKWGSNYYDYGLPQYSGIAHCDVKKYLEDGGYKELMDILVVEFGKRIGDHRKSFILLSGNAKYNKSRCTASRPLATSRFIDLICHFCDKDPASYGKYVVTPFCENMAHPDQSLERSIIWMPPHVKFREPTEEQKKFELFGVSEV